MHAPKENDHELHCLKVWTLIFTSITKLVALLVHCTNKRQVEVTFKHARTGAGVTGDFGPEWKAWLVD